MENKREKLGSRLGFILLSAGCAIGIGNVWRFPYITAKNGGGLFVILYLLFLVILGVPVMCMEFAMGRAAQSSPVRIYHKLTPGDKKWRIHGYSSLIGCVILMMFYTSVSGWMLQYFFFFITGKFSDVSTSSQVGAVFGEMLSQPWQMIFFVAVVVILGFLVCSFDMQKGLEKITKYMMTALLLLIIILAVNSFTLDGAAQGLKFYLLPNLDKIMEVGIFTVIVEAMNQAFFTLSLGIGSMAIFGSFIDKKRSLL